MVTVFTATVRPAVHQESVLIVCTQMEWKVATCLRKIV
jgi:hypothetical protein